MSFNYLNAKNTDITLIRPKFNINLDILKSGLTTFMKKGVNLPLFFLESVLKPA